MYNYACEYENRSVMGYTDLATERRRADLSVDGIEYVEKRCDVGSWERVRISSERGEEAIGRPRGTYDTLNMERLDTIDEDTLLDAQEEIAKRLCIMCDENRILPARILVVGFGNAALTADSVGPKSATRVKPTLQISNNAPEMFDALECSEIAVLTPGVSATCGTNSAQTTRAVCRSVSPDLIIAIDSIATSSALRLGSTVQISDTGLFPGGMGNLPEPITKDTMGVPVISIGVPTVIDSRAFGDINYKGAPLFISPREIDEITDNAATIIAGAINQAFGLYM